MTTVLLMIHLFVTIALIGVVLIQRSEGGGLGIGTAQGMGSFMTGRGTANLLTRATAVLAVLFFSLSLTLALLNRGTAGIGHSLLDNPPPPANSAPASGAPANPAPAGGAPATPVTPAPAPAPAGPSVPTK
jgi:preprotein translocase subunit SecG